jgi:prefoldin subunit 5
MANTSDDLTETIKALSRLAAAMEQLPARYDAVQRRKRRLRVALVILTLSLVGGAAYVAFVSVSHLLGQVSPVVQQLRHQFPKPKLAAVNPERAAAERQRLLASLTKDQRKKVAEFEQHMHWVREYISTSPDFDPGAMIVYFLAEMANSVAVMPEMYAEVRAMKDEIRNVDAEMQSMNAKMQALPVLMTDVKAMNGKMTALPVMATDVQGMHALMSVMARGVDSTMGRMGRMFPFSAW